MNNDQITAIAREYAEECSKGFAPADMPNCLKNEATDILVCNTEDMLKWLSHRYCLVEKEAVRKEYQDATTHVKEAIKSKNPFLESCGKGKRIAIQSIFPEIAKEVEDDSQTK